MTTRKYSVDEIDRMRNAIYQRKHAWWCENVLQPWQKAEAKQPTRGQVFPPMFRHDAHRYEDELRTYMLNGTDPEELEALVTKVTT